MKFKKDEKNSSEVSKSNAIEEVKTKLRNRKKECRGDQRKKTKECKI